MFHNLLNRSWHPRKLCPASLLDNAKVPQAVAQITVLPFFKIPSGHNALLLEKLKKEEECLWYAQQTIQNGWSRAIEIRIEASCK